MKRKRTTGVLYLRNIPPWLKSKFKAKAKREGRTMESVAHELIANYAIDRRKSRANERCPE